VNHHHHSHAPAVIASLIGLSAAAAAGFLVHKENTASVYALHEEMHEHVKSLATQNMALNEAAGRNFAGAAAGMQNMADAHNSLTDAFMELRGALIPDRSPDGKEPPAEEGP